MLLNCLNDRRKHKKSARRRWKFSNLVPRWCLLELCRVSLWFGSLPHFSIYPLLIFHPFNLTFRNPPLSHIGDRSTPPFKRGVPTMSTWSQLIRMRPISLTVVNMILTHQYEIMAMSSISNVAYYSSQFYPPLLYNPFYILYWSIIHLCTEINTFIILSITNTMYARNHG